MFRVVHERNINVCHTSISAMMQGLVPCDWMFRVLRSLLAKATETEQRLRTPIDEKSITQEHCSPHSHAITFGQIMGLFQTDYLESSPLSLLDYPQLQICRRCPEPKAGNQPEVKQLTESCCVPTSQHPFVHRFI